MTATLSRQDGKGPRFLNTEGPTTLFMTSFVFVTVLPFFYTKLVLYIRLQSGSRVGLRSKISRFTVFV
jgi:hypothetical protein